MTGRIGRKVTFTWDGAEIPGVREKGVALAGEAIDVTSDEDDGWRKLLEEAAENQVTISISGVTKSAALKAAWFAGNRTEAVSLGYPGGSTITGTFYLASYSESEPYNGATTFEAEIQSTGEITYTAAAVPSNTLLPAVIGTPQVGVALTAFNGNWTNAPTAFTYQWQEYITDTWTNISGATAATYTPVVGSVGRPLRVIVTAVNTAGSTPATSGPSADILAA
jgi:predicted secreted protein